MVGVDLRGNFSSVNYFINVFHLGLEQKLKFWNLLPSGIWGGEKNCLRSAGMFNFKKAFVLTWQCHVLVCRLCCNVKYLSELNSITKRKNWSRLFGSGWKVWTLPCHSWYRTQGVEEIIPWSRVSSLGASTVGLNLTHSFSFLRFPSFPNSKNIVIHLILVPSREDGSLSSWHCAVWKLPEGSALTPSPLCLPSLPSRGLRSYKY